MRLLPSLLLAALLLTLSSAHAQNTGANAIPDTGPVAVYRLTFSGTTNSINFRGYTGGYYVADLAANSTNAGTLILLQAVSGTRKYYQTNSFGALFSAVKASDRKAIFVGTSTTGVSTTGTTNTSTAVTNTTFYATGSAETEQQVTLANGEAKLFLAKELKGTAIFCDSQDDLPFAYAAGESFGTAAQVNLTLKLDERQSQHSSDAGAGRATMVTKLVSELTSDGYTNGNATATPAR